MKKFRLLCSDNYQLSMGVAYLLLDQHNDKAGFEAFYRRPNPKINSKDDKYIFYGGYLVRELIRDVKRELEDPELIETFISIIKPKLPVDKADAYEAKIRKRWATLDKDFIVHVYPDHKMIKPFVPAVQFKGAKLIGQILETPILNIINGKTGSESLGNKQIYTHDQLPLNIVSACRKILDTRAKEYREATSKVLLEAAFRRSPSFHYALWASEIAINNGWDGTSNTSVLFDTNIGLDKVGGTMAHSFIMSQVSELEAYKLWNSIYPNSTMLIDTYDIKAALSTLVDNDIKPAVVRLDSEPLDQWAIYARAFLDIAGWEDVKIFISGDLTPERLRDYEERKVPFDMCMAGTAYANVGEVGDINAGFVYKLVQFESGGEVFYPQKKSEGKGSISKLKTLKYDRVNEIMTVSVSDDETFGFNVNTYAFSDNIKDVVVEI